MVLCFHLGEDGGIFTLTWKLAAAQIKLLITACKQAADQKEFCRNWINNLKIEDRIKTIVMFSCIIYSRGKKPKSFSWMLLSLRLFSLEAASKTVQINEMFHHPESKPSHCLLTPIKQMDKMKLTQEKCVVHNHTGHCPVPVIRKHWNQQQCFLCFQWTLKKCSLCSLAPSSPAPKSQVLCLQSWHLQQGEISLSLLCCGCWIVNSCWYHKTRSSGKHLNSSIKHKELRCSKGKYFGFFPFWLGFFPLQLCTAKLQCKYLKQLLIRRRYKFGIVALVEMCGFDTF